jgi:hypothetical protein
MLQEIMTTMQQKGYLIHTRPYELNIVGIRANTTIPNSFDDTINVFYKNDAGGWLYQSFPATTDPGTYWLKNIMNPQGTAILKEGQYIKSHGIGMHRGKYLALTQKRNVTVLRDVDRNNVLNFNTAKQQTGIFGINIHHASSNGTTKTIDRYSAGCQVFANINDFNSVMVMAGRHKQLYGNDFNYTLIRSSDLVTLPKKN